MTHSRRVLLVSLIAGACCAQTPAAAQAQAADAEIWKDFAAWSEAAKLQPPGSKLTMPAAYVEHLQASGVSPEEAKRRCDRMNVLRRGSLDTERVYWNGAFKFGAGPSTPLRLLQEALVKVKPGRALDAGMGRGRNAIYLASIGWDVTGYDMSPEALKVAAGDAARAGVRLKAVEAKHDTFEFGENQWDLILCSYNYMRMSDPEWPGVLLRALKPGGIVVFQTSYQGSAASESLQLWKQFKLVRFEDVDAGIVEDDWGPSRTNRTVKLVVRKE